MTISTSLIVAPVVVGLAVVGTGIWVGSSPEEGPSDRLNDSSPAVVEAQHVEAEPIDASLDLGGRECPRCEPNLERVIEKMRTAVSRDDIYENYCLLGAVASLTVDQFPQFAEAVSGEENADYEMYELLFDCWGQADPQGAVDWIVSQGSLEMAGYAEEVFEQWVLVDPAGMAQRCLDMPDSEMRTDGLIMAVERIAAEDPAQAIRIAETARIDGEELVSAAIDEWIDTDPMGALSYLRTAVPELASEWRAGRIVAGLIGTNRPLAMEVIDGMATESEREGCLFSGVCALANSDPNAATELVFAMQSSGNQLRAIEQVARSFVAKDPESAIEWVKSLEPGSLRNSAIESVLDRASIVQPGAAAELIDGLPNGPVKRGLLRTLVVNWGQRDLDAATQWVTGQEDPFVREQALSNLAVSWAQKDPAAALGAVLTGLKDNASRSGTMHAIGRSIDLESPEEAEQWIQQIPHGKDRDSFVAGVIQKYTHDSPREAARYASGLVTEIDGWTIQTVGRTFAGQDPAEAAAWAVSLGNEANRSMAIEGVMNSWISVDPESTGLWIAGLPRGATRETAMKSFVGRMTATYPEAAVEWVWEIEDPSARESAINGIVNQWRQSDPAAAEKWIEESGLSADRISGDTSQFTPDNEEVVVLTGCFLDVY